MAHVEIGTTEYRVVVNDDSAKLGDVVKAAIRVLNEIAPDSDDEPDEPEQLRLDFTPLGSLGLGRTGRGA